MRQRHLIALGIAGVMVLVALSLLRAFGPAPSTTAILPGTTSAADAVLAVDDLRNKPERFTGEIQVFGVVGGTKDSEHLFGLVDKREVEACGTMDCPEFLLPVRWRGAMPPVGDEVTVAGELQLSPQGLVLEATKIDAP